LGARFRKARPLIHTTARGARGSLNRGNQGQLTQRNPELGPSSAGPLFLPAREARGQERSSKTIKLEAPAARSAAGVSTGRLRRPDRSGQF